MKQFEFNELLAYIMWMINELAKFNNKSIKGFRINSLSKLADARSQKFKDVTATRYLTEKLVNARPDILTTIKGCFQLSSEVLKEITKTSILLPKATQKLFDITNMLKRKDVSPEFKEGMKSFMESLRSDLLGINQQLEDIDKQIAFLAGITYDVNVYKDKPTIKDILSAWTALKNNKIIEESEVASRIKRESERYAFFNELNEVFKTITEGEKFLIEKKLEAEKQERARLRKEAVEAARKAKEVRAVHEGEGEESTLDLIKSSIEEEKEMALSYEKLITARSQWKKLILVNSAQRTMAGIMLRGLSKKPDDQSVKPITEETTTNT